MMGKLFNFLAFAGIMASACNLGYGDASRLSKTGAIAKQGKTSEIQKLKKEKDDPILPNVYFTDNHANSAIYLKILAEQILMDQGVAAEVVVS